MIPLLFLLVAFPWLMAFAQDSTGVLPPSGPFSAVSTVLLGAAAAFGTKLVGTVATQLDLRFGNADNAIRKGLGPAFPFLATGWAIAIPLLGNKLGITDLPPADVLANAPLSAIAGITIREAARKWVVPLISKGKKP